MIKWFSAVKNFAPTAYEKWFEQLAAAGFHPRIGPFSFIAMRFDKGPFKKYKYVVDLNAGRKRDYISFYQNCGWEFVGKMASLYIWRREEDEDYIPAFSDRESLRKRNERVCKAMTFSTVCAFFASLLLWIGFGVSFNKDMAATWCLGILGGIFFIVGAVLFSMIIIIVKSLNKRDMKSGQKDKTDN